jgi:DNA-binding MarR family transcriptional regulator
MEKGYIIKERSLEDQRIVNIIITDEGRNIHRLSDEALLPILTLDLQKDDLQKFYDILLKM